MILRPDWQKDRRLKAAIKKQGKDFGFGGADGKKTGGLCNLFAYI